jgi:hypothetical protein
MKHTYFVTALTVLSAFQAHGMEPEEQAPHKAQADALSADGWQATIQDSATPADQSDRIYRIRICKPPTSEDIANSIRILIEQQRQHLKNLTQNYDNSLLPSQPIPQESDPDLHLAIFFQLSPLIQKLVSPYDYSHLAKVNAKGQTALEYARERTRLSPDPATIRTCTQKFPGVNIPEDMVLTAMCAEAKQNNQEIVTFLEQVQKEYVIECAKKVITSSLTHAEITDLWLTKDDSLSSEECIRECGHAALALVGETHPAVQPIPQAAAQPVPQAALLSSPAGQSEEKEDEPEQLGHAGVAEQVQDQPDIDMDLWFAQWHEARQQQ